MKKGQHHKHSLLIDQGSKDEFLETQLLTENFIRSCQSARQELQVHFREGYDHSYYFIATFIEEHITFHARALKIL